MSHDEQQNEISRKPGKTVKTIYFVLIWFGVILALSLAGAFAVHDGQLPVPLIIALVVPILVYVLGVTHSNTPLGIFAQEVSMRPITQYPLGLIPAWAVPLAIILHLRSLQSLREPQI
jgi:hypothetical protein